MKEESLTPKLTIPLFDKVCVAEFFQNRSENLLAVGLKSSVDIVQLLFDDSAGEIGFEFLHKLDHGCRVQCLAWCPTTSCHTSPRSIKYATGGADHHVRLVSLDLGSNPRESVRTMKGHRDYVNAVVFQPDDGSQVVSGSDDHTVMLWDSLKGNHLHSVTFHSPVMSLAWHPEEVSKLLVGEKNGVIHIFNIVSYHPIMSLDCGPGPLSSVDWNLTNSLLVAVAVRSDVTVWDLSKMSPISKTYLRQDIVRQVKMAPFSESVFATTGLPSYSVKISNTKNAHGFQVMANLPVGGITWHPRKHLLAVGHDEKLSVFQIAANKFQN